jgi:hypothetical protein
MEAATALGACLVLSDVGLFEKITDAESKMSTIQLEDAGAAAIAPELAPSPEGIHAAIKGHLPRVMPFFGVHINSAHIIIIIQTCSQSTNL